MSSPEDRTVGDVLETFSDEDMNTLRMCIGAAIEGKKLSPDEEQYSVLVRESLNEEQKKVFNYLIGCALGNKLSEEEDE